MDTLMGVSETRVNALMRRWDARSLVLRAYGKSIQTQAIMLWGNTGRPLWINLITLVSVMRNATDPISTAGGEGSPRLALRGSARSGILIIGEGFFLQCFREYDTELDSQGEG
jgi:hypothetical protein